MARVYADFESKPVATPQSPSIPGCETETVISIVDPQGPLQPGCVGLDAHAPSIVSGFIWE